MLGSNQYFLNRDEHNMNYHQTQRFKRRHVFTANAHWIHAFVMFFVDEAVNAGVVQNSVGPVENEIVVDYAEKNLPNDLNSYKK